MELQNATKAVSTALTRRFALFAPLAVAVAAPSALAQPSSELDTLIANLKAADAAVESLSVRTDPVFRAVREARPTGVCNCPGLAGFAGFGNSLRPEDRTTDEEMLREIYEEHIRTACFGNAHVWVRKRMEDAIAEIQRQKAHYQAVLLETNYEQLHAEWSVTDHAQVEAYMNLVEYRPRDLAEAIKKAEALPGEDALEIMKGAA